MIKKADIVLFILILVFGLAVSWWSLTTNTDGDKAIVTVDGELYGTYSLSQDQTIEVVQDEDHINYITIKDGMVSMAYSTCKNQVCVNAGAISETRDSIVCLPNKVMIEIQGSAKNEGGGVDVITG